MYATRLAELRHTSKYNESPVACYLPYHLIGPKSIAHVPLAIIGLGRLDATGIMWMYLGGAIWLKDYDQRIRKLVAGQSSGLTSKVLPQGGDMCRAVVIQQERRLGAPITQGITIPSHRVDVQIGT